MAIYRVEIPGCKPVLIKDSSKAKALDQLVKVESLSAEQMAEAIDRGEKTFKAGDRIEVEPEAEAAPEKAPEKE